MRATTLSVAITSLLMIILNVGYVAFSFSELRDTDYLLSTMLNHAGSSVFYGALCVFFFTLFNRQKKTQPN